MLTSEKKFLNVLSNLQNWNSYEKSSKFGDISKLDGITLLLEKLGNPEKKNRIIHIAGTNGKGSTALIISKLLKVQGFATGCYTSPHLTDIRERIRLNGTPVSKTKFVDSASIVLEIAHELKGSQHLSYFDLLTAIAFHVFMINKMEWIVLETGLGGRLDSTNVTDKELCVLTKVGFDHQDILGIELKDIAAEKIGITRPEIPIIISYQEKELKKWLKIQLHKKNVPTYFVDEFFEIAFPEDFFLKNFSANPQIESLRTSLCTMQILFNGDTIQREKWFKIAQKHKIPGRLDLKKNVFWKKNSHNFKKILIDVSHNKDSIFALVNFISQNEMIPYTLILGMASDKLVNAIKFQLKELCSKANKIIYTPINSPRTANTQKLENFIFGTKKLKNTPKARHVNSAEEALEICASYSEQPIVIAGSFYLAGEIMKILKN